MFSTKINWVNPDNQKEIILNTGRFGPYLKCENKSARIENIDEIFSIGLNRAITLIAEAKPGRMSSSIIKDLGEHPEDILIEKRKEYDKTKKKVKENECC